MTLDETNAVGELAAARERIADLERQLALTRRQTEDELRLHAERYRILTENAEDIIWIMDASSHMMFISPAVTRILGFEVEELEGQPLRALMTPETMRIFEEAQAARWEREARGERDTETKAWCLELLRRDGSLVWTESLITPIRDSSGVYTGLLGITRDATTRILAHQALERAKDAAVSACQAKSEFLATMSHEIRTPLNGIMGMLQLLQSTPLNAEQSEFVDTALASSRGLLGVISDVLDYSRMEAGKLAITADWFDLRRTLDVLFKSFRKQLRDKGNGVELGAEIASDLPAMIRADEMRVRQILTNLIGNAVKFTSAGRITVRVSATKAFEDDVAVLHAQVLDTGMGIPSDAMECLFEPFTQVERAFTRQQQGSGLGLSIVRRLLILMGGSIELRSEVGLGTDARFSLPVGVRSSRPVTFVEPLPPVAGRADLGRGLHILLVDDDRFNERMLGTLLRSRGFAVTGASNGRQALEALRVMVFDAVIMDIQMPELDGLTATRIIRTDPEFAHVAQVPLVALTAHAMHGDRDKFLAAGMDAYLSKPVNMQELLDVIGTVVRRGA